MPRSIPLRRGGIASLIAALAACSPAPPPDAPATAESKQEADEPAKEPEPPVEPEHAADASDAGAEPDASAPAAAPYVEPPPVKVYRFHVYAAMKSRWKKKIIIESLVSTSKKTELEAGEQATLERKVKPKDEGSPDWVPVADVLVKKIGKKGRIELELVGEHPEAKAKGRKSPFLPRTKVRLQVDRKQAAPSE